MSRFSDTVRDERGHPIPGVTVYVYEWDAPSQSTGALSALTDDDLTTALLNPLTTDEFGQFYFNTSDGVKQLEFHYGGKLLFRQQVGSALVSSGTAVADSTIALGQLVNLYDSSGVTHMRLADGADPTKPAHAFCAANVTSGNTGIWTRRGVIPGTSATTFAPALWLSDTVPGAFTSTVPTTAGHISQNIGMVLPGFGVEFDPQPEFYL
jgi:hypothetical protein